MDLFRQCLRKCPCCVQLTLLKFVQCLSNPLYLNHLASQKLLDSPEFIAYLDYLQYFGKPEYIKYLS